MSIKSFLIAMFALICSANIAYAQNASDPLRPKWMHRLPVPTNSTFIYQIVPSTSHSLEEARSMAVQDLINEVGMKSGVVVLSNHKSTETVSQVWENGKLNEVIKNDMQTVNTAKGHEVPLHASLIDEYWIRENTGTYHLYRLYAKSELGQMPLYDNVVVTTSYLTDPAMWGFALIPGAAQMYKGSYLKGGLIMGGSVAFAAGAVACSLTRKDYISKMANTHSANVKQQYAARANGLNTGMYICLGGLAALYVYNLIDAIAAPGGKRIIVYPSISTDGSVEVSGKLKF